jgi:hypothetical protein
MNDIMILHINILISTYCNLISQFNAVYCLQENSITDLFIIVYNKYYVNNNHLSLHYVDCSSAFKISIHN